MHTRPTIPPLFCAPQGRVLHPSQRYISVIRRGAAAHNLDPRYLDYLHSLPAYTPRSLGQRAMYQLMLGTYVAVIGIFAGRRLAKIVGDRVCGGRPAPRRPARKGSLPPSPLVHRWLRAIFTAAWTVHDALAPVVGSGAS